MMLGKPQIPQPRSVPKPTDWGGMQGNFGQLSSDLQNHVRYLQQYLGHVYNAVIPAQQAVTNVVQTQSPYTVLPTDSFIAAAAGSAATTTINLPIATGSGRIITVKKIDSNAEDVILGGTIDGASGYSLTTQYQLVSVIDGTNQDGVTYQWFIKAKV